MGTATAFTSNVGCRAPAPGRSSPRSNPSWRTLCASFGVNHLSLYEASWTNSASEIVSRPRIWNSAAKKVFGSSLIPNHPSRPHDKVLVLGTSGATRRNVYVGGGASSSASDEGRGDP